MPRTRSMAQIVHPRRPANGHGRHRLASADARRARLVADGGGLENRYGVTPIVGSNPTPSAHVGRAAPHWTASQPIAVPTVSYWAASDRRSTPATRTSAVPAR